MGLVSSHTRKILVQCLFVTTPMIASSLAVACIVYANLVDQDCPSEELCPGPDVVGAASSGYYYYVDFPAASLALVSSGSSTLSFTLIGCIMTMSAYTAAASFLRASEEVDHEGLPSPRQLSTLIKALNAEWVVLWSLAWSKIKEVFWHHGKEGNSFPRSPEVVRTGVLVLMVAIIASLLVQAADVYFHIAIESVAFVQMQNVSSETYQFGRGLAPWCLDRPTVSQQQGQKNYFGCAITAQPTPDNTTSLAPTNATIIQDMKNSVSDLHQTLNFTNASGVQHALVGPANADATLDWKASSLGVSTTCSAIPEAACNVSSPISGAKNGQGSPIMLVPFRCSKPTADIDISGNLTSQNTATHMMNFHKYAAESAPFFGNTLVDLDDFAQVLQNINSGEDANDVLKNNWNVLVMRKIPSAVQGDFSHLPPSFQSDTRIWKHDLLGAFVLLNCNVTVWDMTYTSINTNITVLAQTPSNGSTAGIASMPGTRFIGTLANIFQDESTGPPSRSSPQTLIQGLELGMSKAYSYALASQLSPRPSLATQTRFSHVVTRLPVSALWLLVTANLCYALLGLVVAGLAVGRSGTEGVVVGQVKIRLGVEGLVAALFDRGRFEQPAARCEEDLFEEGRAGGGVKKIAITGMEAGGFWFALYRRGEGWPLKD
ncbi:hypothetical protein BDW02DRAFT_629709 [Decorospora gaudefroyi]|uniref:Uncharacterized protein n=1 Tax=Decorospora gaudefroyi TaxID=184978 RepID=A0A6A5KBJ2_9PLEO|nr:hypothetical protein BDW02DRAFT_629709 [Decorospora gaudefroyi]